jgi:hypothetical protein
MIAVDGNSIDGSLSLVAQVRERSVGDNVPAASRSRTRHATGTSPG